MLTKADFQNAIKDSIAAYPAIAPLYNAGDPRITQHLDAMATMLAMLSAQIETAMAEPFEKVRDATVLADAAMRGIIRKGVAARVRVKLENKGTAACTVDSGRTVFDAAGMPYRLETSATVAAGESGSVEAVQLKTITINHIVAGSVPFYSIEIPVAEDGAYLCSVGVKNGDGDFTYSDHYVNVSVGDRVFHIETDDRQRVYVRFGLGGVAGVQPLDGAGLTLTVAYTFGNVSPAFGSPFAFEYMGSPAESSVELSMHSVVMPGQDPIAMNVLRDLAKYPSIYDSNAVFLGEFDFLVRRNFPTLQFLSVWNESAEEQARGASVNNINTLFVACLSADGSERVLAEVNSSSPLSPIEITTLTGTQVAIKRAIWTADDSYKVRFFTPIRSKIVISVDATIATSYVASDIRAKIIETLLINYGETSAVSKRGRNKPLYQQIYALLKLKIPALSTGLADLLVNIQTPPSALNRPELWRYVATDSLTVTVSNANVITPQWGG